MIPRAAIISAWLALVVAAYTVGLSNGATLMLPSVEHEKQKAFLQGGVAEINKIAEACKKKGGFGLRRNDGEEHLFMCIGPVDGYQYNPRGKPIIPQRPKTYQHPQESQRF